MSVSVDRYTTSKFILKDDEAVAHIKNLVELLQDECNLSMGYTFKDDYYASLYSYGDRTFKFVAGGYADSGPELRYSVVYGSKANQSAEDEDLEDDELEEEDELEEDLENDPVCVFSEIQKNLQEGTWFFVENHCIEKSYLSSYVALYHQDGRTIFKHSHDSKMEILKKLNIEGKVE